MYQSYKPGEGTNIKAKGGGGGGVGVDCWKFQKESLKGTKILFCGSGLNKFLPLRGTNSKSIHKLTP